jgi:hypothetical protein
MPQSVKDEWRAFCETNKNRTVIDVVAEIEQRAAQERERSSKKDRQRLRNIVSAAREASNG